MTKDTRLHELVFLNDTIGLLKEVVNSKQHLDSFYRGQTPLTLAISLGHAECISILLKHGASSIKRNVYGWSPFQEATSYGDRNTLAEIHRYKRKELSQWVNEKGKRLLNEISNDLQDLEFELQWSFSSFVPLVSSLCPSDTYKIYKQGSNIRIDTTLVGFERLQWIRGNISFLFHSREKRFVVCDHDTKLIQQLWPRDFTISDQDLQEDISVALNTPIMGSPDFDFQNVKISRAKSGFFGFKYDKNETIDGIPTSVWNVDSFELKSSVRDEHLYCEPLPEFKLREIRAEEKKKEKEAKKQQKTSKFVVANPDNDSDSDLNAEEEEMMKKYKPGFRNVEDYKDPDHDSWKAAKEQFDLLKFHRDSLKPPSKPNMEFENYFSNDEKVHLGREMKLEESKRQFTGKMWMYQPLGDPNTDFPVVPFRPDTLYPLLSLIGLGNEHFRALNDFLEQTLPPGYPVQLEIPIGMLPLSAVIKTRNVVKGCNKPDDWFDIPGIEQGYREGEILKASDEYY